MLTLLFAYGAYRNSKRASQALNPPSQQVTPAYFLFVFSCLFVLFLWPLALLAVISRYSPDSPDSDKTLLASAGFIAALLLSLAFFGPSFYFVYGALFVVTGLWLGVYAVLADTLTLDNEEEQA
jgi:hypothetical protein